MIDVAAAGLLGAVIGAWLNSILTMRREKWNLQRELYSRLLEHLSEAAHALELLYGAVLAGPGRGENAEIQWDVRIGKLSELESHAKGEIRRATSVGAIMLSDEAIEALKSFQKEWNLSGQVESWGEHVSIRLDAARKAYDLLLAAAKNDLAFQGP